MNASEGSTIAGSSSHLVAVYLQDACLQHRYIRSRDTSNIVERPERLRAVKVGLAAAIARLEEELHVGQPRLPEEPAKSEADDLADAIGRMNIASASTPPRKAEDGVHLAPGLPIQVVRSSATVDLLNHAAAKHIHGDIERDVYLEKLRDYARSSRDKIANGELEIFEGLNKGDLYRKFVSSSQVARHNSSLYCQYALSHWTLSKAHWGQPVRQSMQSLPPRALSMLRLQKHDGRSWRSGHLGTTAVKIPLQGSAG